LSKNTLKGLKSIEKQVRREELSCTTKHQGFRKRGVGISVDKIVRKALRLYVLHASMFDYEEYKKDLEKEVVQLNREVEELEEENNQE